MLKLFNNLRCRFQELMSESICGDDKRKPGSADGSGGTDEAYYESYGHFGIHEEMIKDRVRTESYRDAIIQNGSALFAGRIVLDVGCGTGILSMFAAQAGAKKVYAVDFSDIAYNAMDIVNENGLGNVIVVKHGRVEDLDITEKVDIIISEWMGYGLLFECMLESVLYARNHFLTPTGHVLPDKFHMYLCGLSDEDLYNEHVTFWSDVYGYKMTCMRADVIKEASLTLVQTDAINTTPSCIQSYDLNNRGSDQNKIEFVSDWAMTVQKDSRLIGWVLYFDTHFDSGCDRKVSFSTSPLAEPTHWKQTIFLLQAPVEVTHGEQLTGKVAMKRDSKDSRALKVHIQFKGQKLKFALR